jgi:hypothetical protein
MSENRRSEGYLVTLQFCTAMSNIPAGTPLGILTATNQIFTLGASTTGFSTTANLGGRFIGIADQDISANDTCFPIWVNGVFELTAASAWTTAYVGYPVMADSGKVCINAGSYSGQTPIGSYIPQGVGERSGSSVLVKIRPVMWDWSTYGAVMFSGTAVLVGDTFPQQL